MFLTGADFITGNSDTPDASKTVEFNRNLLPPLSAIMGVQEQPWQHVRTGDGATTYGEEKISVTDSVSNGKSHHRINVDIKGGKFYRWSCRIEGLTGTPTVDMLSHNAIMISGEDRLTPTGNGRWHITFQADG